MKDWRIVPQTNFCAARWKTRKELNIRPTPPIKVGAALFVLFLTFAHGFCTAQTKPTLTAANIYDRTYSSVVVILTSNKNAEPSGQGSGFIVAKDRVITNHHVLEGADSAIVVFADGSSTKADGIAADSPARDLSIISVKTGSRSALRIGDELSVHQGDPVYALGAPRGLELSITSGIVSGFRRLDEQFLIQTTAPIAPGSSGGPLFNGTGQVIGVTTLLLSDSPGIYFSIGAGDVSRLARIPGFAITPFGNQTAAGDAASKLRFSGKGEPPPTVVPKEAGQADVGGTYHGSIRNITANITSTFTIFVHRDKKTIYGCMVISKPLYGSGPLRGSLDGDDIYFDVSGPLYQIKFQGKAKDRSISGTYRVIIPAPQNGQFELDQISSGMTPGMSVNCATEGS